MCEFCLDPSSGDRDQFHPSFAGFFSADAINAAVRQANASRRQGNTNNQEDDDDDNGSDTDSDGT